MFLFFTTGFPIWDCVSLLAWIKFAMFNNKMKLTNSEIFVSKTFGMILLGSTILVCGLYLAKHDSQFQMQLALELPELSRKSMLDAQQLSPTDVVGFCCCWICCVIVSVVVVVEFFGFYKFVSYGGSQYFT